MVPGRRKQKGYSSTNRAGNFFFYLAEVDQHYQSTVQMVPDLISFGTEARPSIKLNQK